MAIQSRVRTLTMLSFTLITGLKFAASAIVSRPVPAPKPDLNCEVSEESVSTPYVLRDNNSAIRSFNHKLKSGEVLSVWANIERNQDDPNAYDIMLMPKLNGVTLPTQVFARGVTENKYKENGIGFSYIVSDPSRGDDLAGLKLTLSVVCRL